MKFKYFIIYSLILVLIVSCKSTDVSEEPQETVPETIVTAPEIPEEIIPEPEEPEITEEPEEIDEDVILLDEVQEDNEE